VTLQQAGATSAAPEDRDPRRRRTYVLVVVVEAFVIGALWAFSRYFG
jgi:hypothetical protein